jgi:hypothetical protein
VAARLESVKAHSRDSAERFTATATDVRTILTGWYERLAGAGGGDLVAYAATDASGIARLEQVPAGEWLLVAFRTAATRAQPPARASRRDGGGFAPSIETTGYKLINYWRMRLAVPAGETAAVRLTDRGVWLAAVEAVVKPGTPPPISTERPGKYR